MMPIAIEHDIGIREFEELTFKEVGQIIEVRAKRREKELKNKLMQDYQMVDLMSASIGRLFSEKVVYPEIFDIYPTIFGEELAESVRQERLAREQEAITAQWKMFAEQRNSQLRKSKSEVEK